MQNVLQYMVARFDAVGLFIFVFSLWTLRSPLT